MKVNPRRSLLTPIVLLVLMILSLSLVMPSQPMLTASNLALNSARWVLSNAFASYNAAPSASIVAPAKSATVTAGNVTINANALDDGTISSVQYRVDPINNGAFTNMTLVSGSLYTATANLTPGTHSIQVRVTDSTGKSSTTANVVIVQ